MSNTVDSKVVEMRFDNSKFESNVKTSLNTLDKLKTALNLDGATKGLEGVSEAAKKVDMSELSDSVDAVQVKFSKLSVVGATVLSNLTSSAMSAGKSILSSVSSMIVQGGKTRALNIEQAKFQFEGLGMDVEECMACANEAVTDTAYGLDEAAKAAAMFGASGMQAGDDMTSALRAIAGAAAMTGDDYSSIADIFTTVAGNGKLMTEQLRQFAFRGLNVAATLADVYGVTESEMRQMVTDGEISFEDFYKAMDEAYGQHAKDANNTFTGAFSNLKAAFARIGADFWTPFLENMKNLINAFTPVVNAIHTALSPALTKIDEIITKLTNKTITFLNNLDIDSLVAKFKMTDENATNLSRTFKGFTAILDILKQALRFVGKNLGQFFNFLSPVGSGILKVTAKIGDWLVKLDNLVTESEFFNKTSEKMAEVLEKVKEKLSDLKDKAITVFENIKEKFSELRNKIQEKFNFTPLETLHVFLGRIKERLSQIGNVAQTMKSGLLKAFQKIGDFLTKSKIKDVLKGIWDIVKDIAKNFGSSLTSAISGFIDMFNQADFNGLLEVITALGNLSIAGSFTTILASWVNPLSNFAYQLGTIGTNLKANMTILTSALNGYVTAYKAEARASALYKLAGAVAILAASCLVLSLIDSKKLAECTAAIGGLFTELMVSLKVLYSMLGGNKLQLAKTAQLYATIQSIMKMAEAILILSAAMRLIGSLDTDQMAGALACIETLILTMTLVAEELSSTSKNQAKMMKGISGLIIFAAAIAILANVCRKLGGLSWEEMARGLLGVETLIISVVAVIKAFSKMDEYNNNMLGTSVSIILIGSAMEILANVCKKFANMSWAEMAKGLAGSGSLLVAIGVFIKAFSKIGEYDNNMIATSSSMVIMAAAMEIITNVCKKFAGMSWKEMAKGLTGAGSLIVAMGVLLRSFYGMKNFNNNNIIAGASSMVIMAAAMEILTNVCKKFAGMSWEEIAKGLIALGGAIAELAIGLNFMSGTASGSASLLIAVGALAIMAPVMKVFGTMSIGNIAKGLISLAGAFTILGIAGYVLSPLTLVIMGISAAFALLGVGVLALAGGLAVAGAGLVTMAGGITAMRAAMKVFSAASFIANLTIIVNGIANLIPEAIATFVKSLYSNIGAITKTLIQVITSVVSAIATNAPTIIESLMSMMSSIISTLSNYIPDIVDMLLDLICQVLDVLAEKIPKLVTSLTNVAGALFSALKEAFGNVDMSTILEGSEALILLSATMLILSKVASVIPQALLGALGLGAVIAELALLFAGIGELSKIPGLDWLIHEGGEIMMEVGAAIGKFIGGIIGGIGEGITNSLVAIGFNFSAFMMAIQPFLAGAANIDSSAMQGVKSLAAAMIALTAADLIEGLTSWLTGGCSLVRFGMELAEFGPYIKQYSDDVAGIDSGAVEASANAAKMMTDMAKTIPNEGGLLAKIVGDNSLAQFGKELSEFGPYIKQYGDDVNGLDSDAVEASAAAGEMLTAMADAIPNSGGLKALFAGDNTLSEFGLQLATFGPHIKDYSDAVAGINVEDVKSSAEAVGYMSEAANNLPDKNTLKKRREGEAQISLSKFGQQLANFGIYIKLFSDRVAGVSSINITNAATGARLMTDVAKNLPDSNGLSDFFTGGQMTLEEFGSQLSTFSYSLVAFSNNVSEMNPEDIQGAADTASVMTEVANNLPSTNGLSDLITGNGTMSLSQFGYQLCTFGSYLCQYVDNVKGITEGDVEGSVEAADAVSSIAQMMPKSKDIGDIFKSDSAMNMKTFGKQLSAFGESLVQYSDTVKELDEDAINAITRSANAADPIKTLMSAVPNSYSIKDIFKSDSVMNMETFGSQLSAFGEDLVDFGKSVSNLSEDDVTAIQTAAEASDSIKALMDVVPNSYDIKDIFNSDTPMDMSAFGEQLKGYGTALKDFAKSLSGFDEDKVTAIQTAAEASEPIADLMGVVPDTETLKETIFGGGTMEMDEFGEQLVGFGQAIVDFEAAVEGLSITYIKVAGNAAKPISELIESLPNSEDSYKIQAFNECLPALAETMADFVTNASEITTGSISTAVDEYSSLVDFMTDISAIDTSGVTAFTDSFTSLGNLSVDNFVTAFSDGATQITDAVSSMLSTVSESITSDTGLGDSFSTLINDALSVISNIQSDFESAGSDLVANIVSGAEWADPSIKSTFDSMTSDAKETVRGYYNNFYSAGAYLVEGFATGIDDNTYKAKAKAKAMAKAASDAAAKQLDENSPSKVGYGIGDYFGVGFINGISDNIKNAYRVSSSVAESAKRGIINAVSTIAALVDSNMDIEPTIAPVLDLSNVEAGTAAISAMLSENQSISLATNTVGYISSSMNQRQIQNEPTEELLGAIKKLSKSMVGQRGDTYNVNGVTYSDGSEVADAIGTLIHAVKIGRRA